MIELRDSVSRVEEQLSNSWEQLSPGGSQERSPVSAGHTKQQAGAVRVEFNATSNPLTDQPLQLTSTFN